MSLFKLIKGSLDDLKKHSFISYTPSTQPERDRVTLNADLPRAPYYSADESTSLESLKDTLREQGANEGFVYAQGDLTGGNFSFKTLKTKASTDGAELPLYQKRRLLDPEGNFFHELQLNFVNDHGTFCGVTLQLLRDDSDTNIPVDERPFQYGITVIENVLAPVAQRQVTHISHQSLSNPDFQSADLQSVDDVLNVIQAALKSDIIFSVIKPILDTDGPAARTEFQLLQESIKVNQDNFTRIKQLSDSYKPAHIHDDVCLRHLRLIRTLNDPEITSAYMNRGDETKNSIDIEVSLRAIMMQKNTINLVREQLNNTKTKVATELKNIYDDPSMEAQSKQSYLQRHLLDFAQLSASAIVAGLIIAALVLSPFGVLAAPILVATIAVLVTASLTGLSSFGHLISSERDLMRYLQQKNQRQQDIIDNHSAAVNDESNRLSVAENKLAELKANFVESLATPKPESPKIDQNAVFPSPIPRPLNEEPEHSATGSLKPG